MNKSTLQSLAALVAGLVFAVGLAAGGMTMPANVIGFLDVANWKPALMLVMGGAIMVYAPVYWLVAKKRKQPFWAGAFSIPTRRDIDLRLVLGAATFGVGWAVAGWCPGPALATVGSQSLPAVGFIAAMLVGSYLTNSIDTMLKARKPASGARRPVATPQAVAAAAPMMPPTAPPVSAPSQPRA